MFCPHAFVGYKKKLKFCKNNQSQDVISSHSTRHCKGHNEIIMTFSATWMGIIPFVRRATEMTRLYLQTWCCFYINANFWVMKYIHGIFHYHWYKILLYFIKLQYLIVYRFEKNIIEKVRMPGTTLFEVRSITLLIDNEEFMHDILIVFPWNYESLWSFNWVKGSTVFTGNENYGPFKIARMVISWGF